MGPGCTQDAARLVKTVTAESGCQDILFFRQ